MTPEERERVLELRSSLEPQINGHPHHIAAAAVASLLSQIIADANDTQEAAMKAAEYMGGMMAQDIANNWHIVAARRQQS